MLIRVNDCFIRIPEHHDDSVENVESVAYVTERTLRDDLQQHFHGKDGRKHDIAYLDHYGQLLRLSTDKQEKRIPLFRCICIYTQGGW